VTTVPTRNQRFVNVNMLLRWLLLRWVVNGHFHISVRRHSNGWARTT